jgi:hypothetical protein
MIEDKQSVEPSAADRAGKGDRIRYSPPCCNYSVKTARLEG